MMFDGLLTRLRNAIADAVSRGIEEGFRRGCATVFGPLATTPAIEAHADDDAPATTTNGKQRKVGAR